MGSTRQPKAPWPRDGNGGSATLLAMKIRLATAENAVDIDRVVLSAFGEDGEVVRGLARDLSSTPGLSVPELTFVALADDALVGYVGISRMHLHTPDGDVGILNLTPLAVDPEHQGTGIGRALIAAVIEGLEGRSEPLLFVEGWFDPHSIYSRYFDPLPASITAPPEAFDLEACQARLLTSYDPAAHAGQAVYPEPIRTLNHD